MAAEYRVAGNQALVWRVLGGVALGYIMLLVVLPMGGIFVRSFQNGLTGFLEDVLQPAALASLILTIKVAFGAAVINGVMGLLAAYILVRFTFPGKSFLNALVDLPFAIPTSVSGLMLLAVYGTGSPIGRVLEGFGLSVAYEFPGIVLALLLVTFPFTVRAVQPVLETLDRSLEEVAFTLGATRWQAFWRVTFPSLIPSVLTGVTLTYARALAEFGSVVVVAGNIPLKTQVAAVYVYGEMESYNPRGATSVSFVLLIVSLLILLVLNYLSGIRSREGKSRPNQEVKVESSAIPGKETRSEGVS